MPPLRCARLARRPQKRGSLPTHAYVELICDLGILKEPQVNVPLVHYQKCQIESSVIPIPDIVYSKLDYQFLLHSRHSIALLFLPSQRSAHPQLTTRVPLWPPHSTPTRRTSNIIRPPPIRRPYLLIYNRPSHSTVPVYSLSF